MQLPATLPATLEADTQTMEEIAYRLRSASQRRLDQQLGRYHLTIPQFSALRIIARHAGPWRMSDLAQAAHQVMPTMTGIIDRLVERGLVLRERSTADRRTLCISLTGRQILAAIQQVKHDEMARFLGSLQEQERAMMICLMTRYLNEIQASIETDGNG
jgi:DNA-binding MarR family transcriptional regulator